MRGVSAIVELLLITLLLISLVSLLWLFTSGTINVITKSGTNQTQRTQEIFSTCMIMDSVHGNTIYLKNCGYGVITNNSLGVYSDDTPLTYTMTPQTIGKGGVGTITANLSGVSVGDHDIKITNPNAQTVQRVGADYSCSLDPNCVLDLEFDEGSGTTAHDSSSYHNDGTLVNMDNSNWVNGFSNFGLSFNGNNEYVTVSNIPVNTITAGANTTVDFWMYWNGGDSQVPFGWLGQSYNLWLAAGCFGFNTASGEIWGVSSTSTSLAGRWVHVVAIFYNGNVAGNVLLYIDGAKQSLFNCYFTSTGGRYVGQSIEIGRIGPSYDYCFGGIIDSLKIYNKTVTQTYANYLEMK